MKSGWMKKRWGSPVTEPQLQVALTGLLAAWAVSTLSGYALWLGIALLVAITLRLRIVRHPAPVLCSLRLTTAYTALFVSVVFLNSACSIVRYVLNLQDWLLYTATPALCFVLIYLFALRQSLVWAELRGARALTRILPWIFLSAWFFLVLFSFFSCFGPLP